MSYIHTEKDIDSTLIDGLINYLETDSDRKRAFKLIEYVRNNFKVNELYSNREIADYVNEHMMPEEVFSDEELEIYAIDVLGLGHDCMDDYDSVMDLPDDY